MHTVIFSCIACIHFWICRKVCFICIFIKLFNFCWPHILIIFCHLPDAVNWVVFLVMRWHPVTWLQYSTVQFGEQLPPHLLPKLPLYRTHCRMCRNIPMYILHKSIIKVFLRTAIYIIIPYILLCCLSRLIPYLKVCLIKAFRFDGKFCRFFYNFSILTCKFRFLKEFWLIYTEVKHKYAEIQTLNHVYLVIDNPEDRVVLLHTHKLTDIIPQDILF